MNPTRSDLMCCGSVGSSCSNLVAPFVLLVNDMNIIWPGHRLGLVYGAYRHFQQYFRYIVVVCFIGGGNRSTCRTSLTNCITKCCIEFTSPLTGFELTTLVVIGTDCTGGCKSNYHAITTTMIPWHCVGQQHKLIHTNKTHSLKANARWVEPYIVFTQKSWRISQHWTKRYELFSLLKTLHLLWSV